MDQDTLPSVEQVPAAHLLGRTLADGWTVVERITKSPAASGGHFSIGYIAESAEGTTAFLKALNFNALADGPGQMVDKLKAFTSAFVHERDVLEECSDRKLSRIVHLLASGEVKVVEAGPILQDVPYLILELADGDINEFRQRMGTLDVSWAFLVIKHAVHGIEQLHSSNTAHQDLRPSNVLTQDGGSEMKLGDLGRSGRQEGTGPWAAHTLPGAVVYAPPEQQYGEFSGTWEERRAADLYLAGSLGVQLFLGHCLSSLIQAELAPGHRIHAWNGRFNDLVGYLKSAHARVMRRLEERVEGESGYRDLAERFTTAIGQMTNPDPSERGHPRNRRSRISSYSVRRFVGVMNTLSTQARLRALRERT